MDKAQASAAADALMHGQMSACASPLLRTRRRSWSRGEWRLALLLALLGIVVGTAIAFAYQLRWSAVIFLAELGGGLGMLVGCVAIGFRHFLTIKAQSRELASRHLNRLLDKPAHRVGHEDRFS